MFHHCDADLNRNDRSNHKDENRKNMDFSAYMGAAYESTGSDAACIKSSVNCSINFKAAVKGVRKDVGKCR